MSAMYALITGTRFLHITNVRFFLCLLAIIFVDFAKSTSLLISNSVTTMPRLCTGANVLQRILCSSQMQPELSLVHILRDEIICSRATSPCPVFSSNSEFAKDPFQIQKSRQIWQAKRMDIAAVRVLGCAIADGHALSSLYDNPKDSLHMNEDQLLNRSKYLHASHNNQWFRSFGYNPLEINDSRLAYEAPAFTLEDWMKFCFREMTRQSKKSELPSLHSRAWYACDSFAISTYSKNYHYGMPKCFDVPASMLNASPEQLITTLPSYGSEFRGYIEQCRLNFSRISDDPWSLRDLARDVFYVLRDRWNAVQSVYELAIYEAHKDIQRADEFCETLQWNTCHQNIEFLHLFVENTHSSFKTLTCHLFHDPCRKVKIVTLGKRMHYKDALVYANNQLPGRIVMITNADIVVTQGFDSMPKLNEFLKENNRMFALSRHERVNELDESCCSKHYVGCHDSFMFVPPVKNEVLIFVDHQQNVWGGENKFMYEMQHVSGMKLSNPCFRFRLIHNHLSNSRRRQNESRVNSEHSSTCFPSSNPEGTCSSPSQYQFIQDNFAVATVAMFFVLCVLFLWLHRTGRSSLRLRRLFPLFQLSPSCCL